MSTYAIGTTTTSNIPLVSGGCTATLSYPSWSQPLDVQPVSNMLSAAPTPQLFGVRAVQLQRGWVGQVLLDEKIVREFAPKPTPEAAIKVAKKFVHSRIVALFA